MEGKSIKKQVARAVRTLAGGDILTMMVGHVSCRIPGTETMAILGHSHKENKTLDTVMEQDIITMDFHGSVLEGQMEPPGEFPIHSEIYKARPDVQAVIHGHPETSMVFGIAGIPIVPVFARAAMFMPEVPIMDFAGQIDSEQSATEMVKILGGGQAVLLRGHGHVVVGDSLETAGLSAFFLELNARLQLEASKLGAVKPLRENEIKKHQPTSMWRYYVRKYDPLDGANRFS